MKLEQICVSLELAKKLKEAGWKQESLFKFWQIDDIPYDKEKPWVLGLKSPWAFSNVNTISAPTESELGEELPIHIVIKQQVFRLTIDVDSNGRFYINYLPYKNSNTSERCDLSVFEEYEKSLHGIWKDAFGQEGLHLGGDKSEANARAKCWLYLKENGLLEENKE